MGPRVDGSSAKPIVVLGVKTRGRIYCPIETAAGPRHRLRPVGPRSGFALAIPLILWASWLVARLAHGSGARALRCLLLEGLRGILWE